MSHILDFAKNLEANENGGTPMWRHSWCIGADNRQDNKKSYLNTERPSWTADQITHGEKSASGKMHIPGRGFTDLSQVFWARKEDGGDKAYRCVTIYLKSVPDLFVVDMDEKAKCNEENPLFTRMMESGCPYTETTKGYHFYIYIRGCPDFVNGLKCQKVIDPIAPDDPMDTGLIGEMDIIGRKHHSASNIIEAEHNPLHNADAPIPEFPWDEFSQQFINVVSFMGASAKKKDNVTKKEMLDASCISGIDSLESKINSDLFTSYLDKLSKEGNKRYNYDSYVKVGMICWNNFSGDDEGFTHWMRWAHEDPLYKKLADGSANEHSDRNLSLLQTKWEGFSSSATPLTWKTLRTWANDDERAIGHLTNIYQETYDARGFPGLISYMNTFLAFNNSTSEIIMLDPLDKSCYAEPRMKKPADMVPVFACYQILCTPPGSDKQVMKNPYSIWNNSGCYGAMRRNVCGITFDPSPTAPTNYFNLFQGFEINKVDTDNWTLEDAEIECSGLLNHIKHIWCHDVQEHYDFCMGWFAHILQRPHIKVGCLVCVKSKEGAGKGIVFDFMRMILGNRLYCQISDINELVGTYNSVLEGRLLINGDEVVWGGNIQHGNALKGLITEPEVRIKEKYRQAYNVKNTTAFCMSSNEDRCCSAREGDRRTFALELLNTWAGRAKTPEHTAYFRNISGTKNSSQGTCPRKAEAFAKVLFHWDLTDYQPSNAPMTEFVTKQIMKNWHSVEKWWYRVLQTSVFSIDEKYKKKTAVEVNDGGDFPKTKWVDYDNKQLYYGNASEEFGNGQKVSETTRKKINSKPCFVYPYWYEGTWNDDDINIYPCGRATSASSSLGSIWKKFCSANGVDYSKCPVPLDFAILHAEEHGKSYTCDTLKSVHRSQMYAEINEDFHIDDEFSPIRGMPNTWTQPDGRLPSIRKEDNLSSANPLGETMFKKNTCLKLDFQMAPAGEMFHDIQGRMERSREVPGNSKEYPLFNHTHSSYFRVGAEGCFQKVTEGKWDYGIVPGQEDQWATYLAKWGDGVTFSNFEEDLAGIPLFVGDTQVFQHEAIHKIQRWVYEKDWVFEKFQQQVGQGYGAENIDYRQFWGMIEEMLGGKSSEGKGGLFRSRRLTNSADDRRQYWQFVGLPKARDKFSEWAGRLVNWDDDNVDDEADYSAYGY
mgnify:CR=1 FL=1|tara:strand:+ start:1826 stop:5308 length:3483 start_codon:yes stop_codon:yes gene_type:complete